MGAGMIAGPAFVGPHPIAQFRSRIAPLSYEQARAAILAELAEHTVSVRPAQSGAGVIVRTRGGRYAFRALIGPGEGALPAVITILRSGR